MSASRPDKLAHLDRWIEQNKDFITWVKPSRFSGEPFDFDSIFNHGLLSEEEQLRRMGKISYQVSAYGAGHLTANFVLPVDIEFTPELAQATVRVDHLFKSQEMSLDMAFEIGIITPAQYEQFKAYSDAQSSYPTLELKGGIKCSRVYKERTYHDKVFIQLPTELPWLNVEILDTNSQSYQRYMNLCQPLIDSNKDKYTRYRGNTTQDYTTTIVQIAIDRKNPIDKYLAAVLNALQPLVLTNEGMQKLKGYLERFRNQVIAQSPYPIQVFYNVMPYAMPVYWKDEVVVLKGNPESIVTYYYQPLLACNKGINVTEKMIHGAPSTFNYEVGLLQPFENNGQIFTLDLAQPDTIVVGPRAKLAPYADRPNVYCFDELDSNHRQFFYLDPRPKAAAAAAIVSGVPPKANTSFFSNFSSLFLSTVSTLPPINKSTLLIEIRKLKEQKSKELAAPLQTFTMHHDMTEKQVKFDLLEELEKYFSAESVNYTLIHAYICKMQAKPGYKAFLQSGPVNNRSDTVPLLESIKRYCDEQLHPQHSAAAAAGK
jgi:hypothetical protein